MSRRRPIQRPAGANVALFRGALDNALFMRFLQTDFDKIATENNLPGWAEAKQAGPAGAAARVGVYQQWAVSMGLDVGGRGGPVDKVVGPKTEASMVLARHLGFNIPPEQRANLKAVHEALRADPQLLRQALALATKPPAEARAALRTILETAAASNPQLKAAVDGLIPPTGATAARPRDPAEYVRAREEAVARLEAARRAHDAAPTDLPALKAYAAAAAGRYAVEGVIARDKPAGVPVTAAADLQQLELQAKALAARVAAAERAAPPRNFTREREAATAELEAARRASTEAPTDVAKLKAFSEAMIKRANLEAEIFNTKPQGITPLARPDVIKLVEEAKALAARARAAEEAGRGPVRGAAPEAAMAARVAALDSTKIRLSNTHEASLSDMIRGTLTRYASDAASSGYKAEVEKALKGDPAALLAVAGRLYDPAAMKGKSVVPAHADDARAALQIRALLADDASVPAAIRVAAARDAALTISRGVRAGEGPDGVVIAPNPALAARYLGTLPEALRNQVIQGAPAELQAELKGLLTPAAAPAATRGAFPKLSPDLVAALKSGEDTPGKQRLVAAVEENASFTPSDRGLVPPQLRENTVSIALALSQRTDLTSEQRASAMAFIRQAETWIAPTSGTASPADRRHLGFLSDARATLALGGTFATEAARDAAIAEARQLYTQSRQLLVSAARSGDAAAAYTMAIEFSGREPAYDGDPARGIPPIRVTQPDPLKAYEFGERALRSGQLSMPNQVAMRRLQEEARQRFEEAQKKAQLAAGKSEADAAAEAARLWKAEIEKVNATLPQVRGDVPTPTLSTAAVDRVTPPDAAMKAALASVPTEVLERPKMVALDVPDDARAPGPSPADATARGRGAAVVAA